MKEFSKWTLEEVEEYFQLTPVKENQYLNDWEDAEFDLTSQENSALLALCSQLQEYVHDWNEEELKIHFIGGLLSLADYLHKEYQAFFERRLTVNIGSERLSGTVDCIIAAGRRSPKQPYFCLHEYKPQRHKAPDPWGQVLIAMVAAQKLNQNDRPVYGAYVMGRNWYFVVLDGMTHVSSLAYDATKKDDLRQIFTMLKFIKQMIERELRQKD